MGRDLTVFDDDNDNWRGQGRKVPWNERVKLIDQEFPSARNADWNIILRDNEVFGRLLRDILKIDQMEPGRNGPRPGLDYDRGMQSWKEITGQDYSELPFPEAFRVLAKAAKLSVRGIANRTDISRSRIDRLMRGEDSPTVDDLRSIAAVFKKKPAYFAEYRAEYIMAAIAARLVDAHEMTVTLYRRLVSS